MSIKRAIANTIFSSALLPASLRRRLLRAAGAQIADNVVILSGSIFRQPANLSAETGTYIGYRCTFEGEETIHFGKHCMVASGVTFLTTTHEVGDVTCRAGTPIHKPITVGAGTWIGAGAIIFPGVNIGYGCIIGAGSVVTKSCDPSGIYVGSPAIRKLGIEDDVAAMKKRKANENTITG